MTKIKKGQLCKRPSRQVCSCVEAQGVGGGRAIPHKTRMTSFIRIFLYILLEYNEVCFLSL